MEMEMKKTIPEGINLSSFREFLFPEPLELFCYNPDLTA